MKIKGILTRETEKAILVTFDTQFAEFENVWLPKSQIKILKKVSQTKHEPAYFEAEVPSWLINKQKPVHTYSTISKATAIANFITKNGSDPYCNQ